MKSLVLALVVVVGLATTALVSGGVSRLTGTGAEAALQGRPEAGDLAPEFALMGSDGKTYKLSDYRGKQAVVLAWFARAFSAG